MLRYARKTMLIEVQFHSQCLQRCGNLSRLRGDSKVPEGSMKPFELIEHTADIGILAHGRDLSEAFANVALGLFSIICDLDRVQPVDSRVVDITATDIEGLLFKWLNELIYVFDVEHLLFKEFDVVEFSEIHMKARCRGELYDPSRHELKMGVKSATYHRLEVDERENRVQVILDI